VRDERSDPLTLPRVRQDRAPVDKLRATVGAAQRLRFGHRDRRRWSHVEPTREFDARPPRLGDRVTELGAEHPRERMHRQIKPTARRMPGAILARQGPAGDQVMDVGMELKLAPLGVQHAQESGRIGAAELGIGAKGLDRLGRRLEQGAIAATLVRAQEPPQRWRHREGEQEIVRGQ